MIPIGIVARRPSTTNQTTLIHPAAPWCITSPKRIALGIRSTRTTG